MAYPPRMFRKKKTEWMITWQDNPVRWVIFYFILGTIVSALYTFIQEAIYPLPLSYLAKSLIITLFIPLLTVFVSIWLEKRKDARRKQVA